MAGQDQGVVNGEFKGETRAMLRAIADDISEIKQRITAIEEKVENNANNITAIVSGAKMAWIIASLTGLFFGSIGGLIVAVLK